VLVGGTVVDASGMIVEEAAVVIRAADAGCVATGEPVGTQSDASGRFSVLVPGDPGPVSDGCVEVVASSGGASGRATSPARFTSAEPRTPLDVRVRLERAPRVDRQFAEKIMEALQRAINDNDQDAIAFLLPYANGGAEAFHAGLEDMRVVLGRATRFELGDEAPAQQQPRYSARLFGTTSQSLTFSINDDERIRFHNPVIWYSRDARNWAREFMARIAAGDAERLARLLSPDDLEYPVDRARALMERYRSRIDFSRGRFEFAGIDERRNSFRYRLIGEYDGKPAEEIVELGYGDGLLGLRE
jgi:hypothetical protein